MLPIWELYEVRGFNRPTQSSGESAYLDFRLEVHRANSDISMLLRRPLATMPWIPGFHEYAGEVNTFSTMGFDQRNVDHSIVAGQGQFSLEVVVGSFDPEATEETLLACGECVQHSTIDHEGRYFCSWGDDFKGGLALRLAPPAFDAVGRGGRIAVYPDYVLRSVYTDGIVSQIEVSVGDIPSLWDSQDVRLVAQGLANLGVYAGVYTEVEMSVDAVVTALDQQLVGIGRRLPQTTLRERLTDPPALQQFRAVGSGWAIESVDGPIHAALVIQHDSHDGAVANNARLTARLRSGISPRDGVPWSSLIQRAELVVDDTILLVRLQLRSEPRTIQAFQLPWLNPLAVHE
jgi:hypothetical protein